MCQEAACMKRFWTSTQLNIHLGIHRGDKMFKVSVFGVGEETNQQTPYSAQIQDAQNLSTNTINSGRMLL
jgi:hypothetical protein